MSTKRKQLGLGLMLLLGLAGIGSNCGKTPDENGPPKAEETPYKKTGKEGTITGTIAFAGTVTLKKIDTSADLVCAKKNPNLETEDNVVKDGKLANAFVYIKNGTLADGKQLRDVSFAFSGDVTLDQNGCHYVPHVLGVQTNQKVRITNSDPTQHNIHPTPKYNPEWNQTQPNGAPPLEKTFGHSEVLVPVKCNQHPWMKAYIGVLKHPFFAVSAADGTFTIKEVPPGKYTLVAWHEGGASGTEKTIEVTVSANGTAKADFSFGAAAAASQNSSLELRPALELPVVGGH